MSGTFELPNTLAPGTPEDVRDVQENFESIRDRLNNGLVDQPAPGASVQDSDDIDHNTLEVVSFTVEMWDTGGLFDVAAPDRLTVGRAGLYAVHACVQVTASEAGNFEVYSAHERGGVELQVAFQSTYVDHSRVCASCTAMTVKAEVGDIFRLKVFNFIGATNNFAANLQATWISPAT